jgi:hypothetical protein
MLDVNVVYNAVNQYLNTDRSSYMTSKQFNEYMAAAQQMLFDYYEGRFGLDKEAASALQPFLATVTKLIQVGPNMPHSAAQIIEGVDGVPAYRRLVTVFVTYNFEGKQVAIEPNRITPSNRAFNLSSATRGPNRDRVLYEERPGSSKAIKLYGDGMYTVQLDLLVQPTIPVRGVTTSGTAPFEVYNPSTSVQLQWAESERDNIVDLICFVAGVQRADSRIVQLISNKRKVTEA